jgi:hypothetical protein
VLTLYDQHLSDRHAGLGHRTGRPKIVQAAKRSQRGVDDFLRDATDAIQQLDRSDAENVLFQRPKPQRTWRWHG